MITSPYLSRVLGAEGIGIYSYISSIASYFAYVAKMGIDTFGNREIAASKKNGKTNQVFSNLFFLHLVLSISVTLIFVFYVVRISKYETYTAIQILSMMGIVCDVTWLFMGLEKVKMIVKRNTAIKILSVILIFVFVRRESDLWKYILIMVSGNLAGQLYTLIYSFRFIHIIKPQMSAMKDYFYRIALLFLPSLADTMVENMDRTILGLLSNTGQVGLYDNSQKTMISKSFIFALGMVFMPRMTVLIEEENQKKIDEYIEKAMELVMLLASAFTFGTMAIAREFAPLFWGEEFTECSILIIGLSLTIPTTSLSTIIRQQIMLPYKKDKEVVLIVIISGVVNTVLNILFIPYIAAKGAVLATISAELVSCLLLIHMTRGFLNIKACIKKSITYVLIGMVMFGVVRIVAFVGGMKYKTLFLEILAGVFSYCVCAAIYARYKKDSYIWEWLKQISAKLLSRKGGKN